MLSVGADAEALSESVAMGGGGGGVYASIHQYGGGGDMSDEEDPDDAWEEQEKFEILLDFKNAFRMKYPRESHSPLVITSMRENGLISMVEMGRYGIPVIFPVFPCFVFLPNFPISFRVDCLGILDTVINYS